MCGRSRMRARASDIALAAGVGGGGGGGAGGAGGGGDANGGHGGAGGPHDDAGGADDHNNDGDVGGDDVGPGLYGYFPSSSLAPGHKTPVLLRDGESGKRSLRVMKWGLVPSFTKKDARPDHFRMFNARCETVNQKGIFKRLVNRRRCVVLFDGFYEWKAEKEADGPKIVTVKQPYYVHLRKKTPTPTESADDEDGDDPTAELSKAATRDFDGEFMWMAALYDCWENADGEEVYTFTLLTTRVSERLKWLHDRMPVILSQEQAEAWLDNEGRTFEQVLEEHPDLFKPNNSEDIVWHPVDRKVNTMRYHGSDAADPIDLDSIKKKKERGSLTSFFGTKSTKAPATNSPDTKTPGAKKSATKTPGTTKPVLTKRKREGTEDDTRKAAGGAGGGDTEEAASPAKRGRSRSAKATATPTKASTKKSPRKSPAKAKGEGSPSIAKFFGQ